jgi:hypothetical protein
MREIRLVSDHEDPVAVVEARDQLERIVLVESAGERLVEDEVTAELLAAQTCGV